MYVRMGDPLGYETQGQMGQVRDLYAILCLGEKDCGLGLQSAGR